MPIYCPPDKILSNIRQKKFCNHSCSAAYNNSHKEKTAYYCPKCGDLMGFGYLYKRKKCCEKCNPNVKNWSEITYGEAKNRRGYQVNSRIRELARIYYAQEHKETVCMNCGYSKHVEIHHIKSISSFSDDTPISTINSPENLIALCPNCHWEADNGLLDISSIITKGHNYASL